MAALEMKNLYEENDYKNFIARVQKLTADTQPVWGKMSTAQMLAHCAEIQEVCNGKELKNTPFFFPFLKGFIKKVILNDKPYKQNMPTHPQYLKNDEHDFDKEKQRFLDALKKFREDKNKNIPHPFFGPLNDKERGWAMYKHHSHHLDQFGV